MDHDNGRHDHPRRIRFIDNERQHRIGQNNGGNVQQNIRQTTAIFIRQPAQQRNGNKAKDRADHQGIRRDGFVEQQRLYEIARKERLDQTGVTRLAETQACRQPERFALHHRSQGIFLRGGLRRGFFGIDLLKHRTLFKIHTQPDGKDHHHHTGQERHTPSPGQQLFTVESKEHHRPDRRGAEGPAVGAHGDKRRDNAAFPFRGIFRQHSARAGDFGTRAQPLDNTQRHQQHRREDSNLRIGRQYTNQGGTDPHHGDGDKQHLFAPHAIAHFAEDKGPDDTGDIARTVGPHRQNQRHRRRLFREEDLVKD